MTREEFFDRPQSCYFTDRPAEAAQYCRRHYPEHTAHTMMVADLACEHKFLFDMKYSPDRVYDPVSYGDGKMDWLRIPAGDHEFLWQLNRHRHFTHLGQAYILTGEEKYTRAFLEQAEDWLDNVPLCEEHRYGPWRSLETGLRGEYWCKAVLWFRDSPLLTGSFLECFRASMKQHAEYLMECHSPFRCISNWGIMENHGLFDIALCLPQDDDTRRYAAFALKNLETAVKMQVFPDGVHWEQSPMYHNETLRCLTDVIVLSRRNGLELPSAIEQAVERMLRADLAWIKPDGHQFMTGDSDHNDIRDILGAGAYLFGDSTMRFAGTPVLDYDFVWDFGMTAAEEYERMPSRKPDFISACLEHSGHTYMRSGWGEDANLLHLTCGTMGAGHGHSDKLHVDLVLGGEDVLMDGGRFTYVYGDDRREFKDPTGHNTITVDGRLFTVTSGTWEYSKMCQPVMQHYYACERYEFVQAGHLGYIDLPDGVFVNRKVIWIKPDIYIIADELYSGGRHEYRQYWHFNSRGKTAPDATDGLPSVVYRGERVSARMVFLSDVTLSTHSWRVARQYGVAEEGACICADIRGSGFCSMITVIGPEGEFSARRIPVRSALKGTEYDRSMAEAVEIKTHGREYIAAVCHQEVSSPTDLIEAEGCMGYGCVIVFDKEDSSLGGDVLCC